MKKHTILVLSMLLGGWVSQCLAGGIVLERTRVIYDAGKKRPPCRWLTAAKTCPIY